MSNKSVRITVSGIKPFSNYSFIVDKLDGIVRSILEETPGIEIVFVGSGDIGPNRIAEVYARSKGYKLEMCLSEYNEHRFAARSMRNKKIVEMADILVYFGAGSTIRRNSFIELFEDANKRVEYINALEAEDYTHRLKGKLENIKEN